AGMGVWILNVHGSGGGAMLGAAARAGASAAPRPLILAVTILTSLAPEEIGDLFGTTRTLLEQVGHLATLAQTAGLDGVVASPHEIALVRKVCGARFLIVTPGVRPADAERGDQRRVMTPSEAVRAGADYVVVGRPILAASDPADAARRIVAEIGR
ncbi:MAG TPA: orotidine-5'-phosphate decarboxylase, partial [Candidatus Sulfotelmatobacter sp.]|nr:orotidine-5'-phosphate decarboxylase [Candidatus Sulfotelmatobacter sp.]